MVGECITAMQTGQPGSAMDQAVARMVRAADGKIRTDLGNTSVITDLAARRTTILDHIRKEATIVRLPAAPQIPDPSALGARLDGAVPPPPQFKSVEELGKSVIDGLEVVGKRYTMQPPAMPQAPGLPAPPVISEVWTSTKFDLPVLIRNKGSFGEQLRRCRYSEAMEPPASLFQIPEGYKTIQPAAPKAPSLKG